MTDVITRLELIINISLMSSYELKYSLVFTRHNRLRDCIVEVCRRAHIGVQVEVGNNLTPSHSKTRPADAIPRAQVYVPVTEGLTLSLPVPEVISVKPSKAPDHGHDQASDHTVVKSLCVSFPLSHFTGGLVQSLNMLSERISMDSHTPSILGAYLDAYHI